MLIEWISATQLRFGRGEIRMTRWSIAAQRGGRDE
jgi:hypothetical protein